MRVILMLLVIRVRVGMGTYGVLQLRNRKRDGTEKGVGEIGRPTLNE